MMSPFSRFWHSIPDRLRRRTGTPFENGPMASGGSRVLPFILAGCGLLFLALLLYAFALLSAPSAFPSNTHITIPEGSSLRQTATLLYEHDVIRSPMIFQAIVHLMDDEDTVQEGIYMFPERLSVLDVAHAVTTGEYKVPPIRVTIFEGMRVEQIAEILEHENGIDREKFIALAKPYEGYLFPDTYFIPEAFGEADIIALMRHTFAERLDEIGDDVSRSDLSLEEIVIIASILEREARSEESMRFVAGILLKRMEIGMPLQVDAAFEYVLGKSSAELTRDDLQVDSPYNTYLNTGLPPTPIANPGLKALRAVLNPIQSEYLFYLTAPNGVFHYAETYEQHAANAELYL